MDLDSSEEPPLFKEGERFRDSDPWIWWCLLAMLLLMAGVGAGQTWLGRQLESSYGDSAFHQVSNRQMSLLLWHHPQHMRAHQKLKASYLPGFDYKKRIGLSSGHEEQQVVAPPRLLHLYHTWSRLMGELVFWRRVSRAELREFLEECPEWHPQKWKEAPKLYRQLVQRMEREQRRGEDPQEDLQLPKVVQQAFVGWKNYFREGAIINEQTFNFGEVRHFLSLYPSYKRHHWRNLLSETVPNYLVGVDDPAFASYLPFPEEHIAGFLRVALYNKRQVETGE